MIAEDLLRLALDPGTGTLRNRTALAVCTRAALMAELALSDCLVDAGAAPRITPAEPPQERILQVLREAIDRQPGHRWSRWFTHVSADREAVAQHLVAGGRWQPTGRGLLGRTTYLDTEPDVVAHLVGTVTDLGEFRRAPATPDQAVTAALAIVCGAVAGRPRPKRMDTELLRLLDVIDHPDRKRAVQAALDSAAGAIRRKRSR